MSLKGLALPPTSYSPQETQSYIIAELILVVGAQVGQPQNEGEMSPLLLYQEVT